MDDFELLLQNIFENPFKYLKSKSFRLLNVYLSEYIRKCNIDIWEKETGLGYAEHFDYMKFAKLPKPTNYRECIYGNSGIAFLEFLYFTHEHYGELYSNNFTEGGRKIPRGTRAPCTLISSKCNSDEDAFNKFFELYFLYREKKKELGDAFMEQYGIKLRNSE